MQILDEYGLKLIQGVNNTITHQRQLPMHTISVEQYANLLSNYPREVVEELKLDDMCLLGDLEYYEQWLIKMY